jgi:HAD superfamily phosphatase (TIGR01668 family)
VSNNWHGHVAEIAADLGMPIVAKAIKPLPFAFLKALKVTGSKRTQAAIVGDQLFTDVLGGKLVGIKTVLVAPLSASDLPHTLFLRKVERVLLAGRQPLP